MSVLKTISPDIQAVFDAMRAVLAADPNRTNVNSYASKDLGGEGVGITITDKYGSSASYTERVATGRVFLDPVTASLGPGETAQFTATTLDTNGQPVAATVTWTVQQGGMGTVSASGLYTAPASIPASSTDYVTAKDAGGSSATASIALHP